MRVTLCSWLKRSFISQRHYEEGFDLDTDEQYNDWVKMHHSPSSSQGSGHSVSPKYRSALVLIPPKPCIHKPSILCHSADELRKYKKGRRRKKRAQERANPKAEIEASKTRGADERANQKQRSNYYGSHK